MKFEKITKKSELFCICQNWRHEYFKELCVENFFLNYVYFENF